MEQDSGRRRARQRRDGSATEELSEPPAASASGPSPAALSSNSGGVKPPQRPPPQSREPPLGPRGGGGEVLPPPLFGNAPRLSSSPVGDPKANPSTSTQNSSRDALAAEVGALRSLSTISASKVSQLEADRANQSLDAAKRERKLENENDKLKDRINMLEKELAAAADIDEVQRKLDDAIASRKRASVVAAIKQQKIESEAQRLVGDKHRLKVEKDKLVDDVSAIEADKEKLKEDAQKLEEDVAAILAEKQKLAVDAAARERKLVSDMAAVEADKKKISDDAVEAVARSRKLEADVAAIEAEKQKFKEEAAKLEKLEADAVTREQKLSADKDYLRKRINELRSEVDSAKDAKINAEEELKSAMSSSQSQSSALDENMKRQIDEAFERENQLAAEKDYLRQKIEELEGQVKTATKAKINAEEKLKESDSSSQSQGTGSSFDEQVQRQLEQAELAKKLTISKNAELRRKMKELKEEAELALQSTAKDHKASMDAANKQRADLELKVRELRREVGEAVYSKFVVDQELAIEKRKSSDSGSTSDSHVEELKKQLEDLRKMKKKDEDALRIAEKELSQVTSSNDQTDMLEKELEDMKKIKLAADEEAAQREESLRAALETVKANKKAADDQSLYLKDKLLREKDILRTKLQTVQEEADEALYDKKISADKLKADLDEAAVVEEELKKRLQEQKLMADSREEDLLERLKSLEDEVENAVYAKHVAEADLEKIKVYSSSQSNSTVSDDLLDQLKAAEDNLIAVKEAKADLKAVADAREEELVQKIKSMELEVEAAKFKSGSSDAISSESDELMMQLKDSQERLVAIRQQKQSSDIALDKLKGREKALLNELNTLRSYSNQALLSERKRGNDLMLQVARMSASSATSSSDGQEEKVLELQRKLKLLSDSAAAKKKKDANDIGALESKLDAAEAKKKKDIDEIKALEARLAAAAAKKKKDADDIEALESQLEDADLKKKDDVDNMKKLRSELQSMQDELDEAEYEKLTKVKDLKKAMEGANMEKKQLVEKLESLKEEVDAAMYAKRLAESELEKDVLTSSGNTADEFISELKKELYDTKLEKKIAKDSADALVATLRNKLATIKEEAAEAVDDQKAAAEALEEALKDQLEAVKEEADEELKAAKDVADKRETELEQRLEALQEEVEAALHAKYVAELDADKARSSSASGSGDSEHLSVLQKEIEDLKMEKRIVKEKADTKIQHMEGKIEELKDDVDSAVHAKRVAEEELAGRGRPVAQLQKELTDLKESKEAADAAAAELERKTAAEKLVLRARLQAVQKEADAAKMAVEIRYRKALDESATNEVELKEKLQALEEEVEETMQAKLNADAELERVKQTSLSSQTDGSVDDELTAQLKEQVSALKDIKLSADQRERDLLERISALREEVEIAEYAKHTAEKELEKIKVYPASQTSSEAQELAIELQAAKNNAAAAKKEFDLDKHDMQRRIQSLQELASQLKDNRDDVAEEKKRSDMLLHERIETLREEVKEAESAKSGMLSELKSMKSSSSSQALADLADMSMQLHSLSKQKAKVDTDKEALEEKLQMSDKAKVRLKEELDILKQQAAILVSGKRVAEEEVRALKVSEGGESITSSGSSADAILQKQVEQLKSEKKLSQNLAALMKRRLDADKHNLLKRLEETQEEAKKLAVEKTIAEAELAQKRKDNSTSEVSSETQEHADRLQQQLSDLRAEKEAEAMKMKRKISALENELENSSGQSLDGGGSQERVKELLQEVEHVKAAKASTDKRLEWEKSNKRELREKIIALQEHADAASHAKKLAEDELRQLRTGPGSDDQTNSSAEDLASQLRHQVESLKVEKESTLEQVKALENIIASGEADVTASAQMREAYILKLRNDIESLESNVKALSEENKELVNSRGESGDESGYMIGEKDEEKMHSVDAKIGLLSDQTSVLNAKLKAALKEADDAREAEKAEKKEVLDLQSRMDKTILQLATLKSSTRINMECMREQHEEAIEAARKSGTDDAMEELAILRQSLEDEKAAAAEIASERDSLRQKLDILGSGGGVVDSTGEIVMLRQQLETERGKNSNLLRSMEAEKAQWLKDLEAEKAGKAQLRKRLEMETKRAKTAEVTMSSMGVGAEKCQVPTNDIERSDPGAVLKLQEQVSLLNSDREAAELIAEEAVAESEALAQKLEQAKKEHERALCEANAQVKELQNKILTKTRKDEITLSQAKKEFAAAEAQLKRRISFTEQAHAERIALHEKQINELHKEKNTLTKELEHVNQQKLLKRDATELLDEMERVQSKNKSLSSAFSTMESELKMVKETNNSLENKLLDLTKKLSTSNITINTLEEDLHQLREGKQQIEVDFELNMHELEKYKRLLQNQDGEINVLMDKQVSNDELVSIMKEQLAELQREKTNSESSLKEARDKYDNEFIAKRKLEREISVLKASMKQRDSTMERLRKEVVEQKSTADVSLARLEDKWKANEKHVLEEMENERRKANATIQELEGEIQILRSNLSIVPAQGEMGNSEVSTDIIPSSRDLDPLIIDLEEENGRLRSTINSLEQKTKSGASLPADIISSFHEERELRLKAEEIAAALARRAKSSMERKNAEILDLKMKLAAAEGAKSDEMALITTRRNELGEKSVVFARANPHTSDSPEELEQLRPIVNHLKELYELKDRSLKELQVEKDKQKKELRKYKALAGKLHRQLTEIDEQLLTSGKKDGARVLDT